MRKVTVWENDMTDEIDPKALDFINLKFKGYEVSQLSALSHRSEDDIFDSLRDSYAIVIQPNMIERDQVQELAKLISHPIHGQYCRNNKDWEIQQFVFVDNHPWSTLKEIKSILKDVKDSVGELSLIKIAKHCVISFCNFDLTEHYELETSGYWDTKAVRYK